MYLTFNQQTKVNGDPTKFITLQLSPRLLQASLVNGGLPFTATVMSDGTIRLVLSPGLTLQNPSFKVVINNPAMITSANGQTLQVLQASLDNIILNNYPAGTTSDAPLVIAGTILAIFMIILLITVLLCTPSPIFLTI